MDISGYNASIETEVPGMFHQKADNRILELSSDEICLLRTALFSFRNKVIDEGKPAEDINELLIKIMKGV